MCTDPYTYDIDKDLDKNPHPLTLSLKLQDKEICVPDIIEVFCKKRLFCILDRNKPYEFNLIYGSPWLSNPRYYKIRCESEDKCQQMANRVRQLPKGLW